jgi:hypothetical protein
MTNINITRHIVFHMFILVGIALIAFILYRFLCSSSSTTVRQWSHLRIANRAILFIIVIIGLFYIYVPIVFENIQTNSRCPYTQTTFPLFNGIWNLLIFSLGPSIIMLIFGLLSIRNLGSTEFRPKDFSARHEMKIRVKVIRFYNKKKFFRAQSPVRKIPGPKLM